MALSNNAARVIVSVIAIPVILAACYFGKFFFLIFVLLIALISYYEFCGIAQKKGASPNVWLGLIAAAYLVVSRRFHFLDLHSSVLLIIVLACIIELFRNKGSAVFNLGSTLLGLFYTGLFSNALVSLREFYPDVGNLYTRGGYLIISILASIWICDSAAYYGGSSLGKHKLFPRVSPNKSWEGAIFGFVFAVAAMILAKLILIDFLSWTAAIGVGIIVGSIGQLGDLVESLFKRDAGIKDSSRLIPGHGGILDRFDSLLFSAPVIFLFLRYFR